MNFLWQSVHGSVSGVADKTFTNDIDALLQTRRLFDFLPLFNEDKIPEIDSYDNPDRIDVSLNSLVPENPNLAYDIKELIYKIVDEGDFFEL